MFRILALVFTFIFSLTISNSQESQLRFENQDLNIRGVISIGNKIICYGDYGSILTSNDLGKTWTQTRIGDIRDTIFKLYYLNNKILGFTKSGKNIISDDIGNTWNFSQNNNINDIQAITNDSSYIYIRESNSLKAFNYDLNLVGSIYDTLINVSYEGYPTYLCLYKDKLLINPVKLDVVSISKQDLLKSIANLKIEKYIDSLNAIEQIYVNNNELMILYSSSKYKLNYEGVLITDKNKFVFKNYGNIYNIFIDKGEFIAFRYYYTIEQLGNYNKIGYDIFNYTDLSFVQKTSTNLFATDLGFTSDFKLKDFVRLNDSTMIVVGPHKSIFISYNNGMDWEVTSTKKSPIKSFFFSNNNEYHFAAKCNMVGSRNVGITYKTNEFDSTINYVTATKYAVEFPTLNLIDLDSNGKFIALYPYHNGSNNNAYMLKSWDYGKTFKMDFFEQIYIEHSLVYSTSAVLSKIDTNYFLTQYINYGWNKTTQIANVYSNIYTLDSSLGIITLKKMRNRKIEFANFYSKKDMFLVTTSYEDSARYSNKLMFTYSTDGGDTFDEKLVVPFSDYSQIRPFFLDKTKDTLILIVNGIADKSTLLMDNIILRYVISSNKLDTLYKENSTSMAKNIMVFDSKLFIVGYEFFIETKNRNNLFDWQRNDATGSNWDNVTASDFGFYHVKYSSPKYPEGFYKIYLNDLSSAPEIESEKAANESNITQSNHIELYDILGRSIATFPSYEKLKAEIESYPQPHLIKWRDEKGIYHFERMK